MAVAVWGRRSSANVQKVLWALTECGVPFERKVVGGQFGGVNEPWYRAMNPNGLVPVYEEGDLVLFESDAILRHVARTYGMGTLWPDDPKHAARADMWTTWTSAALFTAIMPIFLALVRKPRAEHDTAPLAPVAAQLAERMAMLDRALEGREYLCGPTFSYGEIGPAIFSRRAFLLPYGAPEAPNVRAWHARLAERPAWAQWIDVPLGSCKEEWDAHEKALG